MVKRRTNFFYLAALLLIIGIGGFLMPLAGKEIIVFRWLGQYGLIGKIACLALGGVSLVIGFIRYFTGPKPEAAGKQEEPPQDKQGQ
jgi:hypothetical protein